MLLGIAIGIVIGIVITILGIIILRKIGKEIHKMDYI